MNPEHLIPKDDLPDPQCKDRDIIWSDDDDQKLRRIIWRQKIPESALDKSMRAAGIKIPFAKVHYRIKFLKKIWQEQTEDERYNCPKPESGMFFEVCLLSHPEEDQYYGTIEIEHKHNLSYEDHIRKAVICAEAMIKTIHENYPWALVYYNETGQKMIAKSFDNKEQFDRYLNRTTYDGLL